MKKLFKIACVLGLVILVGMLFLRQRERAAEKVFAELLPKITAVTLYDIHNFEASSSELSEATSAPFSLEVFHRACALAKNEGRLAASKGCSLAVLKHGDGSERRALLSYNNSAITIHGMTGCFVVPAEFHGAHMQMIQGKFIPRRRERN